MKYTIDARDKKLGRIASEAASILMGKNSTSFAKNKVIASTVEILNVENADISAHKKEKDVYVTYSGFRGGLNKETLGHFIGKRGVKEVFKRAIKRMLPNNKLRDRRMKNLIIK